MHLPAQRLFFRATCALTDRAPQAGARLLDASVMGTVATQPCEKLYTARTLRTVARLSRVGRVLVLPDIHLGDAVALQSLVTTLRAFFPEAEVEYGATRAAACLIEWNPEITRLHRLYMGTALPSPADERQVAQLCRAGGFDLVVNCCPFFLPGKPLPRELPILHLMNHAPRLLRNQKGSPEPNHFLYQAHAFLDRALRSRFPAVREVEIRGVHLTLSDRATRDARCFLERLEWKYEGPLVLINADAASPFSRPPFGLMLRLVEELAAGPARLLIGEGHTDRGIGRRLIGALARGSSRARLVPADLGADTFTALIDQSDVFISGDTGPLHWAAARKRSASSRRPCRNRTCVVSLFGATPARMSGYDSRRPGFLPAWQDAPSAVFDADPPCRNITCLNKLQKTCRVPRCFEGLDIDRVAGYVGAYLAGLDGHRRIGRGRGSGTVAGAVTSAPPAAAKRSENRSPTP